MINKLKVSLSSLLVILILMGSSLSFAQPVSVYWHGEKVSLHTEPIIMNGRVLVPMRSIFDKMNFEYEWDNKTKTVVANYDSVFVELQIGNKYAKLTDYDWDLMDEVTIVNELDAPPIIKNGYTMIPIRYIGEAFGMRVSWDQRTQSVFIDAYPKNILDEIYLNDY